MSVSIDKVFEELSPTITLTDIMHAKLLGYAGFSKENIINDANNIIQNSTTIPAGDKPTYFSIFKDYINNATFNKRPISHPTASISGERSLNEDSANLPSFLKHYSDIKNRVDSYAEKVAGVSGDISQIGFYKIPSYEDSKNGIPTIIPSSVSIQETLLNQPAPTIRTKSAAVIPNHKSKHIVNIDILFPTYESFANTDPSYPSFSNLLTMFKFMPVNTIYCPILSSVFISEYTVPLFFDRVNQVFTGQNFDDLTYDSNDTIDVQKAKVKHVLNKFDINELSDITEIFNRDDPLLDFGMDALIRDVINPDFKLSGNARQDKELKRFVSKSNDLGFPIPVAFKSASIQTHNDMPGAIIGRFSFGIVSSPAFPNGTILYKDEQGNPSFDPIDCYWGKKYISIANQKVSAQIKDDMDAISRIAPDLSQNALTHNDFKLYYFDTEDGLISFDTSDYKDADGNYEVLIEKVSGAFNTKSVDIGLMNSKYPTVQYLGMNSNAMQMIFVTKNKAAIADFMKLKARIVDFEQSQTLFNSYGVVRNSIINSLGISRITPQSVAIESDPDSSEVYRIIVTFMENYEDFSKSGKLRLEKGVVSLKTFKYVWDYLYKLYLIWTEKETVRAANKTITQQQYQSSANIINRIVYESDLRKEIIEQKLDSLMRVLGIRNKYNDIDDSVRTVLNPGLQGLPHDTYFGPLFMGILDQYAKKAQGLVKSTGIVNTDFPAIIPYFNDAIISTINVTNRKNTAAAFNLYIKNNIERNQGKEVQKFLDILFNEEQAHRATQDAMMQRGRGQRFTSGAIDFVGSIVLGLGGARFILKGIFANQSWRAAILLGTTSATATNGIVHSLFGEQNVDQNLVEFFHKKGAVIPKDVWDSTLDAILERRVTKGQDVFVTSSQMERSFSLLMTLIGDFSNLYTFDEQTKDGISSTKLTANITVGDNTASIEAKLNLSKILEEEKKIESANNQIINMYPDMYLPTYRELLLNERDYDTEEKRLNFLDKFGPRYSDFGVVPKFTEYKEMFQDITDMVSSPAVTLDHFIDPDIFYYRNRDVHHMQEVASQYTEDAVKKEKESANLGKTIKLPISWSTIQKRAREDLKAEGVIDDNDLLLSSDDNIKNEISSILQDSLSSFREYAEAGDYGNAALAFSRFGIDQLDNSKIESLHNALKAVQMTDQAYEDIPEERRYRRVYHLEFITNEGNIIGELINDPNTVMGSFSSGSIGESATYYNDTEDLSFAITDNMDSKLLPQQILHHQDLTESLKRSFPTVRLYIIEEDRETSFYKDDFYGFGDVMECHVTSHIHDNDICRLKLANFGGKLTQQILSDETYHVDIKKSRVKGDGSSNLDVAPNEHEKVSVIDDEGERFLLSVMLRPGMHIMVKMGYGNNVEHLRTVFTGEIAEINPGPFVELVAQGYQTELHGEIAGFMEENEYEMTEGIARNVLFQDKKLKFKFLDIINNILLLNGRRQETVDKSSMPHLGDAIHLRSARMGIYGALNSWSNSYDGETKNVIRRILGREFNTLQDAISFYEGEDLGLYDGILNGIKTRLEANYFGFSGTDVSKNIYVSTSNNTTIHVAREWLIQTGTVIDSLREVIRYMPNFICTVVPYEQDATIFIGDPEGVYQYRKATKIESQFEDKYYPHLKNTRDQDNLNKKNSVKLSSVVTALNNAEITDNNIISSTYYPVDYESDHFKSIIDDNLLANLFAAHIRKKPLYLIDANKRGEIFKIYLALAKSFLSFYIDPYRSSEIPEDIIDNLQEFQQKREIAISNANRAGFYYTPVDDYSNYFTWLGGNIRKEGFISKYTTNGPDWVTYRNAYHRFGDKYLDSYRHKATALAESSYQQALLTQDALSVDLLNNPIMGVPDEYGDGAAFNSSKDYGGVYYIPNELAYADRIEKYIKYDEDTEEIQDKKANSIVRADRIFVGPGTYSNAKDVDLDYFFGWIADFNNNILISDSNAQGSNAQKIAQHRYASSYNYGIPLVEELITIGEEFIREVGGEGVVIDSKETDMKQRAYKSYNAYQGYRSKEMMLACIIEFKQIINAYRDMVNQENQLEDQGKSYESNFTNYLPWNYKVFRDTHVVSTQTDMIANNVVATESDMWSAVGLRVPSDTLEERLGTSSLFDYGIEEGGVNKSAGIVKIASNQNLSLWPDAKNRAINYLGKRPGPNDTISNFTEINSTTDALAQMAFKFRLAQGMSKMYRGSLICLGKIIKPYDCIYIVDDVNHMYGKVMAERVVQSFTVETGWTTTIIPCGLTRVNSKLATNNLTMMDRVFWSLANGKTFRYFMNAATIALLVTGATGFGVRAVGGTIARSFIPFIGGRGVVGSFQAGMRAARVAGQSGGSAFWGGIKGLGRAFTHPSLLRTGATAVGRGEFAISRLKALSAVLAAKAGGQGLGTLMLSWNNLTVNQTQILSNGDVIHQPMGMSLLTYNGAPFIAGLEDAYEGMTNYTSIWKAAEYAFREWVTEPQSTSSFDTTQAINDAVEGD